MRPDEGHFFRNRSKQGSEIPLNQNRNNNRRRGRNNRGGQGGGGNQGNRIDSRARGNAPQMLEKYKKLAHDASLNGDRVQTEYYLQFADHYFRVIADQKSPRDDQQGQRARHNERDRDDDGDFEDDDRQPQRDSRNDRDDRDDRDDREDRDFGGQRGSEGESDAAVDDVRDNPFVREGKPRRPRTRKNGAESEASGLDPAILPPSIGNDDSDADEDERPRRRTRTRRLSAEEEAREAHG
jgi:hypothetical protein